MFFSTGKVSHFVLSHLLWWYKSLVSQKKTLEKNTMDGNCFYESWKSFHQYFILKQTKKETYRNHIHESTREITNLVFKIT